MEGWIEVRKTLLEKHYALLSVQAVGFGLEVDELFDDIKDLLTKERESAERRGYEKGQADYRDMLSTTLTGKVRENGRVEPTREDTLQDPTT